MLCRLPERGGPDKTEQNRFVLPTGIDAEMMAASPGWRAPALASLSCWKDRSKTPSAETCMALNAYNDLVLEFLIDPEL